jgi:phosphate transport system permease protein
MATSRNTIQRIRVPPLLRLLVGREENRGDALFRMLALLFALLILLLLILMVYKILEGSWVSLREFGARFFIGSTWDPVRREFGVLPLIYGTIVSSALALLFAVPVSLGAAVFLAELAPRWIREPASFLVELLAAIPSVVYGLWGLLVLAPWLRVTVQPLLQDTLGFLPLFQGPALGVGMLAGGLILSIMILPLITSVSRDVLLAVPTSQREGMLALGATRWETIINVIIPYARSGIIGAIILGLGRALGETMAIAMVIGNRAQISASLFSPAATLASIPANQFTEADYELYVSALVEIGLVLLAVTLIVNILARLLVWRVTRGPRGEIRA